MFIRLAGDLAFLTTVLGLLAAALGTVYALVVHKLDLAKVIGKWTALGLGIYFGLLITVSLTSREQVLGMNEEKSFCALDCDLAFSVVNISKTKTVGSPPHQDTAQGTYYVVSVKAQSHAAGATMTPDNPRGFVVDDRGRTYGYSSDGQRALELVQGKTAVFSQAIEPGSSYTIDWVFDLPSDAKNPCLVIDEGPWITHLIVGEEDSFFHKKTKIRLETAGRNSKLEIQILKCGLPMTRRACNRESSFESQT